MEPFIRAAGSFLKSIGLTELTYQSSADRSIARFKGKFKDAMLTCRVQLKAEWGTDLATSIGTNWNEGRYPFKSVQFVSPTPKDGTDADYTHFMIMAGDCNRLAIAPKSVIENAPKGWLRQGSTYVQTANVDNWTPKLNFFRRTDSGWEKDTDNIWKEPIKVPMDPDAFLASL